MVNLYIHSNGITYDCAVEEGIGLERQRRKAPSKLTFTVLKDGISFQEGDSVSLVVDGVKVFYGFVFTKKRNKLKLIDVTAYDQLRYLKNKDTYVYTNKTAKQVLEMVANDFKLNLGTVVDTKYRIASAVEDNKELFEIIYNPLDTTTANTGILYNLYDDYGKINLQELKDMKLDILLDADVDETFTYETSIDSNTYNKVKLIYENKEKKKREVFIAQDTSNMNLWGVLQYTEKINENTNGQRKADSLLSQYNKKSRVLNMDDVLGDPRVRGGSVIPVALEVGDMVVANYMIVEHVKHTFKESEHKMSLRLIGGEFIA